MAMRAASFRRFVWRRIDGLVTGKAAANAPYRVVSKFYHPVKSDIVTIVSNAVQKSLRG
ncbi:hypothetical protein [Cohnella sp.]|uniref:hypothetical protein n=1 Tax=Cohnella sp. TaxID=1883426 RepID=UPI003565249A